MSAADLDMSHGLVAGVWFLSAVVAMYGFFHHLSTPVVRLGEGVLHLVAAVFCLAAAVVAFVVAVTV